MCAEIFFIEESCGAFIAQIGCTIAARKSKHSFMNSI